MLPGSPRNYGNLWVKYDADDAFEGLSLGAGVTVIESSLGDTANSFVLPGYALLNGMIAYTTKIEGFTVTAQLNVKNITDTIYYPSSSEPLPYHDRNAAHLPRIAAGGVLIHDGGTGGSLRDKKSFVPSSAFAPSRVSESRRLRRE